MKERIKAILEREIAKLDAMSSTATKPLAPADIKSLDVLIRAFRALVDPASNPPAGSPEKEPEPSRLSDEDLINEVLGEQVHS